MFLLDGTPTDGHTVAELEQALRQAVARVRDELIDPAELKRVVTQAVADKVYEADSLFNQATEIGVLETIGLDWRLSTTEIDALKAVTPEQVRTVAQRYLIDDNLTVATLIPLPMDQQQPRAATGAGGRHGS
jgi:zinc protease